MHKPHHIATEGESNFFVSSRDLRFQLIAAFPYKVDHFQQKHEASLLHFLQNVKRFTHESRLKSLTKPKCVKLSDYTCSYLRLDERKMSTSIAKKLQCNGNNSLKRDLRALSVAFTKGTFHLSELAGRTIAGPVSSDNEIGFLLKNRLLGAYYLGFDSSGWRDLIKIEIIIALGMVWQVSSDKWKAP